ncbi:MmcQ/YjbR family DNA-binding protein [Croceivirga thetidis]|uniref:MmcQ/YjbR family DNA-binding protein n=1 Tax=Croceivirga thetidis TaxID=2721623 RepID=A0ABX1GLE9_9FLAO|nr:MmcQ/YjbR family DNA-binding protein [Croceivirga thetidis]NKI30727.1 MmcQ/YjbR family DNA-binding protein [Croceivirga thetidis]
MNVEEFRAYCLLKKWVTEEFPFDEHTLVFKVAGKMFALYPLERQPPQANLKCDPDRAIDLREQFDGVIFPGYHMSKKHWNTILLGLLPRPMVEELIDHSYDLVWSKIPKKVKSSLDN